MSGPVDVSDVLRQVDRLFSYDTTKVAEIARDQRLLVAVQTGALRHPDPYIRRSCLWALDHYANDTSLQTFAAALSDEMHFVRDIALHSIACESCKCQDLDASTITASLITVLETDPKPDLRIKALTALLRFAERDDVRAALARSARVNTDTVVRRCATDAPAGCFTAPKKRYERGQRRHAAMGHGTDPARSGHLDGGASSGKTFDTFCSR